MQVFHSRVVLFCASLSTAVWSPVVIGAEESKGAIEEVVVTARYREETAQETPVAITAFNQSMLQEITALDLRDVGPQSPNVHIQPNTFAPNSSAIHIRGMGALTIESTNELRNGVSVNGVYISRPVATLIDFFDVDTVQVLRGPQGTTFGKNSLSGAVAVDTIKPDGTVDYRAEVTGGNYDRLDFRGAVQFPIIEDKLSARISGLAQNYDGHYKNRANGGHLNGEDVDSIRGTLSWTPTENFDATLIYGWLKERSQAPGGDDDSDPNQLINIFFAGAPFFWNGEPDDGDFTVGRDALDFYDTDQDSWTGIMNWDVGNYTLTSITGYISTDDFAAADFDQTELPFFPTFRDQEHSQFSQEIRVQTDFSDMDGFLGNLELVGGLFYFEQKHEIVQSFPTLGNPSSADYAHQKGESKAIFGQAIYAINDRLNFLFGVRYTDEHKDFERNPGTLFGTQISATNPSSRPSIDEMSRQPMTVNGELDSDRTTIKVGVDYQFTDYVMGFATYSQGYKAGEFGARAGSDLTAGPTDDETSDAFEVGVKSDLLDGRLRANATAFYTNYKELAFEVFFPSPNNPTGQETASQNIGEATVYGLELELTAVPIDGLTLQGVLGLLHSEYDDFCADLDGPAVETNPVSDCGGVVVALPNGTWLVDRDHTDLELTRAPKTQIYLSAQYDWNTSMGGFHVRAATDYESKYSAGGTSNNPKGDTGDFWLMDASTGWTSPDDKWRVQAWCKNCTDKHYTSGLTPTAQFFNQHFWGLPRTYGLTLAYQK
ncbi:MAG: TonB-dependent receptor [Pseudomonadales bacterium]|nr:TonB-dependent receptor [Pseudomonadales bacterium]